MYVYIRISFVFRTLTPFESELPLGMFKRRIRNTSLENKMGKGL